MESLHKPLLLPQPKKDLTVLELLAMCGELIAAIDDSTDWFILSRWERDPVKKAVYEAIYEAKNKQYLKVLEDSNEKLAK